MTASPPLRTSAYVGRSVPRLEDRRLVTGAGQYVGDLHRIEPALTDAAHLVLVRSPHPCAVVRAIDCAAARAMPGVLGVWTGRDLSAAGLGGIPWEARPPLPPGTPPDRAPPLGDPGVAQPQPVLACDMVRFQGEPVAAVVAETLAQALDAADAVAVDYAPRDAVIEARAALAAGAPLVWEQAAGNVCFTVERGDKAATTAAFARAAHVVTFTTHIPRLVQNPIEPRSYGASYDGDRGRFTLYAAASKPQLVARAIARDVFHIPEDRIRVVTRDVGGGFGVKNQPYPEQVLVLWAARETGRAVRWTATRAETFLSDGQARDQGFEAALALDRDGRILAARFDLVSNIGAYLGPRGVTPPVMPTTMITNVYDVPALHLSVRAVHTHTVPTCPYRGAGAPEATFAMERLIDLAARDLGVAPGAFRRRSLVAKAAMPYRSAVGAVYDSGDFAANMDAAERMADGAGFAERRRASEARGLLRGLGYANMVEAAGHNIIPERADVSCTADGTVTLRIGTTSNGQSHETVYAQLLADGLGIAIERIRVLQGDSDEVPFGMGTSACRSMTVGGSALVCAAERLIELGRPAACDLLEAADADVIYADGAYQVIGTDRRVMLEDVAARAIADGAPADRGLEASHTYMPAAANYPNGCHIAEVEVDPDTGVVTLDRYTLAQDVGRALNPMVVAGQLHGGVAQGVGEALLEQVVFDPDSGQLLSGSFVDYAMPRARDLPAIDLRILEVPCTHTATGAKSCGEAGATAAPVALVNAIVDALAPLGVRHVEMPATPERVVRAIAAARGRQPF